MDVGVDLLFEAGLPFLRPFEKDYSGLQTLEAWMQDDLCWCSFFLGFGFQG